MSEQEMQRLITEETFESGDVSITLSDARLKGCRLHKLSVTVNIFSKEVRFVYSKNLEKKASFEKASEAIEHFNNEVWKEYLKKREQLIEGKGTDG